MPKSDTTISKAAERAIGNLEAAKKAADKYNDYGSVMGICDEVEEIENDLRDALYSASRRSSRLARRIADWESGRMTVVLLSSPANAESIHGDKGGPK